MRAVLFGLERIILRITGIFIIIAIIFSYLPAGSIDSCQEEDRSTYSRMDCGYAFHCPIIYNPAMPELSTLTINGWLKWVREISKIEELPNFIFHPPKA